jgi:hypothetical protein
MDWDKFPLGPEMLEKALGPRLGALTFRILVVVAVLGFVGAAVFGGLHGVAMLRSDYAVNSAPVVPASVAAPPTVPVATNPPGVTIKNSTWTNTYPGGGAVITQGIKDVDIDNSKLSATNAPAVIATDGDKLNITNGSEIKSVFPSPKGK